MVLDFNDASRDATTKVGALRIENVMASDPGVGSIFTVDVLVFVSSVSG